MELVPHSSIMIHVGNLRGRGEHPTVVEGRAYGVITTYVTDAVKLDAGEIRPHRRHPLDSTLVSIQVDHRSGSRWYLDAVTPQFETHPLRTYNCIYFFIQHSLNIIFPAPRKFCGQTPVSPSGMRGFMRQFQRRDTVF